MDSVTESFKKFGTIVDIKLVPETRRASIKYKTHQEALSAFKSTDVFFYDPSVKVYWRKEDTIKSEGKGVKKREEAQKELRDKIRRQLELKEQKKKMMQKDLELAEMKAKLAMLEAVSYYYTESFPLPDFLNVVILEEEEGCRGKKES